MTAECPMMVCFTQKGDTCFLYCGKWSCGHCRKHLAREWAEIARFGVQYGRAGRKEPVFWTFTLPSKFKSARDGYGVLKRLWDTLRKAIQREQGRFDYLAFIEGQAQRGNMPHFHVICFAVVPRKYNRRRDKRKNIKDFAAHCGFGGQAEELPITGEGAAAYVSKYVSKGTPEIPKGFRRVRPSQSWPRPPKPPKKAFIVRRIGEDISSYLLRVEDACDRDIEELSRAYQAASLQMELERLEAS